MNNESIKNDRRNFLGKLVLFVGSIFFLSKLQTYLNKVSEVEEYPNYNKLTNQEISDKLKNNHSNNIKSLKPELPPINKNKVDS